VPIFFDTLGNRLAIPAIRRAEIADWVNTFFFGRLISIQG
jgi:hypothetical protein